MFLVDRKKDMLKTSGFQVWPREIEEVISAHPAVLEVGVAGIPDPAKGEVAKAWIVLKRDVAEAPTSDEIRASVAKGWRPTRFRPTSSSHPELPKTMVGKVLRRVLVAETMSSN